MPEPKDSPQKDLEGAIVPHGKTFDFNPKDKIDSKLLEIIPWEDKFPQLVSFITKEFTAVCPFSGLPDIAQLVIEYVPDQLIVELRSFKYYITTFRDVGIYQEEATDLIAKDLWHLLEPKHLLVRTVYNTRGGYDTTAQVSLGDRAKALEPYTATG